MYTGNDNYLQDLYNYNQNPNNNYNGFMNNNYMQTAGGFSSQPNFTNNMCMLPNMYQQTNIPNITNFYPSIYRIINPIVSRVVQNSNYQFLNEDTLNNMVDTVFSIVDGQIEYKDEENSKTLQNQTANSSISNNNQLQNQRQTGTETNKPQTNTSTQNSKTDDLLRDIIKILIIKEILSRKTNVTYMNY